MPSPHFDEFHEARAGFTKGTVLVCPMLWFERMPLLITQCITPLLGTSPHNNGNKGALAEFPSGALASKHQNQVLHADNHSTELYDNSNPCLIESGHTINY